MREIQISSPFRTRSAQVRFLLLVAFLLVWPLLESTFVSREKIFDFSGNQNFSFSTYVNEVYRNQTPLDFAFIGPCTVWWQVFPEHIASSFVQAGLSAPQSIVLGYNHFGMDLTLLLFTDLIRNRQVKNLVIPLPRKSDVGIFPHPDSFNWWIYSSDFDSIRNLGLLSNFTIYSMNILGSYRRFSTIFQPTLEPPPFHVTSDKFGTYIRTENQREPLSLPQGLSSFGPERPRPINDWLEPTQKKLLEQILLLAKEKSVRVFFLSSPLREDFNAPEWQENRSWIEDFPEVSVIGLAPQQILKLYKPDVLLDGSNLTRGASKWLSRIWGEQLVAAVKVGPANGN